MRAADLLAAARERDVLEAPFVRAVVEGTASRQAIRAWAANLHLGAGVFARRLFTILGLAEEPAVRESLLENLLDEEGVQAFSGGRLIVDRERRHTALASRMARALGASDEDFARQSAVVTWLDDELAAKRWVGPLAYLTVGFEANIPATFRALHDGLTRHYGADPADLEFLSLHCTADERHSEHAAALLVATATTPALQAEALEGVRRGTAAWFFFHARR
jgi:pyrroloquinoline quinone (PQQ) biosynthesis protein C